MLRFAVSIIQFAVGLVFAFCHESTSYFSGLLKTMPSPISRLFIRPAS